MFSSNLRGKRYRFQSKRLPKDHGTCDPRERPNKAISISRTIRSPMLMLDTLIHEALHGCLWDLDEAAITETAECIARVLIKAGVAVDVDKVQRRLKQENQ